jgi:hypothetical protein
MDREPNRLLDKFNFNEYVTNCERNETRNVCAALQNELQILKYTIHKEGTLKRAHLFTHLAG